MYRTHAELKLLWVLNVQFSLFIPILDFSLVCLF